MYAPASIVGVSTMGRAGVGQSVCCQAVLVVEEGVSEARCLFFVSVNTWELGEIKAPAPLAERWALKSEGGGV